MTTIRDIYEYIDSFAPFQSAMSFDNVGLLVGSGENEVGKVLVALDITPETVSEAAAFGAGLIISHHPVIFNPLRTLSEKDVPYLLAREGIAAICAHTNLDMSQTFGVNLALAEKVGIRNLCGMDVLSETGAPQWFLGELVEEMTPDAFAHEVKRKLNAGSVRYTEGKNPVVKVGLCSGSGGEYLENAYRAGADAFLTGEMRHHEYLIARSIGITAVEAGHFATEAVVTAPLCAKLSAYFPDVVFKPSEEREPVRFL